MYCTVETNYRDARSIARPLWDSTAICKLAEREKKTLENVTIIMFCNTTFLPIKRLCVLMYIRHKD